MLPGEIEPFATAHTEALETVRTMLIDIQAHNELPTPEQLEKAHNVIRNAQRGFDRFKICMADEVAQKNRYRDMFLKNRPKP